MIMKKALFVTSRNVLTSCGEIRLIKNRAEALYNIYGISTDFICIQQSYRINAKQKEQIKSGGEITCFPISFTNPIKFISSYRKLEREMLNRIKSGNYGMVVLSGFAMNRLVSKIKKISDIYTVIDVHGAAEDSLLLAKHAPIKKSLLLRLSYYMGKLIPNNSFKYADGCFVVTQALKEYVKKNNNTREELNFYRVPCATSMNKIEKKDYILFREKYRKKYNIASDEKVFIYSGGVSPWQCIDETIELYNNLSKRIKGKSRLIMFSYNLNVIKDKLKGNENVILDTYKPDELTKALCAGDYAFFLRKDCVTNNVAFPNKYLEYLLAGMYIISTPYVYESAEQIKNNHMGYLYDFKDIDGLVKYIDSTKIEREYMEDMIERILLNNSFDNTLKPLILKIK